MFFVDFLLVVADVLQERREARLEQAEAEKYERQKTELEEAQVTHVLLRLALIEREIADARSDREKASRTAEQQRSAAATSHEELKARRKEQISRCKDLARAEESIKKAVCTDSSSFCTSELCTFYPYVYFILFIFYIGDGDSTRETELHQS